jgi:2-C-methyl-D-erythritol 4-phosphate cytidylyltransferase
MVTVLILAGGVDPQFKMNVPKQFVNIFNKPVFIYAAEAYQKHPMVDRIMIASLPGWEEMVRAYAKQFNITKLTDIVTGGAYCQDTSYNAVKALDGICVDDDILLLADAIRPMVEADLITGAIRECMAHGNGVACVETMDMIMDKKGSNVINRYDIVRIQTPQAYKYGFLKKCHEDAEKKGITSQYDISTMVAKLGNQIFFSKGSDMNMKINTVEDVEMFKALYKMKNSVSVL